MAAGKGKGKGNGKGNGKGKDMPRRIGRLVRDERAQPSSLHWFNHAHAQRRDEAHDGGDRRLGTPCCEQLLLAIPAYRRAHTRAGV